MNLSEMREQEHEPVEVEAMQWDGTAAVAWQLYPNMEGLT